MDDKNNKNIFGILKDKQAIHSVWKKHLDILSAMGVKSDIVDFLCICFSLFDDGNTCIPLNRKKLEEKWNSKWSKLIAQEHTDIQNIDNSEKILREVIENGISSILNEMQNKKSLLNSLFVIKESKSDNVQWLFTEKFYNATKVIHDKISDKDKVIFDDVSEYDKILCDDKIICNIIDDFKEKSGIELKSEQAKCIKAGADGKNFIITGGPGTGKTTVVTFMLWKMLCEQPEYCDWEIKFAAPSGKAAQRITQSVVRELKRFSCWIDSQSREDQEKYRKIKEKIENVNSYTIEKLLEIDYNGKFRKNDEHQFDHKNIIVIDEASMIDIVKFASILKAIPSKNSESGVAGPRVFILGDDKQLQSVDEGAVLGNILTSRKEVVIELKKSNRFNDESQVGRLSRKIMESQNARSDFLVQSSELNTEYMTYISDSDFPMYLKNISNGNNYPVGYIEPVISSWIESKKQIEKIVDCWAESFYLSLACDTDKNDSGQILCAQREGIFGCKNINEFVDSKMKQVMKKKDREKYERYKYDKFYPGQKIIILDNINSLGLYNGDTGVVKEKRENGKLSLAVYFHDKKKEQPLDSIPLKSIESSWAITIHKSQGSGYDNILIFLPVRKNHPLLTRQMLYTAITRTQGQTFIVSSLDIIKNAIENLEVRYTGLDVFK